MSTSQGAWSAVFAYLPEYLSGLRITVEVSIIAFAFALLLGILAAAARRSHNFLLRTIAAIYVEAFRNTPLLLQIFVAYFGLPAVGVPVSNFQAGVGALAVNAGAYLTETIRGGIEAVPKGQYDATHVLALSRLDTFTRVVLPQAIRNVYPPIVNQFIQIVLGSSLLSAIALNELTGVAENINSATLRTMQAFAVALALYLIVSNAISLISGLFARYAFRPPLESASGPGALRGLRQLLSRQSPTEFNYAATGGGGTHA